MDAIAVKWKSFGIWVYVLALSSWTIPTVLCENATTQAVCESCDLAEKHKLYNWLVLCIVLLLLVLLLLLVGFLCHRMWPRDPSVLDRAVCRYNLEQQQGVVNDLTQASSSSWGTETTPINCDRPHRIRKSISVYLGLKLKTIEKRKMTKEKWCYVPVFDLRLKL